MSKTQKLAQAIISKIHGLPWEEAVLKDLIFAVKAKTNSDTDKLVETAVKKLISKSSDSRVWDLCKPTTLSRVLHALGSLEKENEHYARFGFIHKSDRINVLFSGITFDWIFLDEDKSTATLEDQSEETIEALSKIFLSQG